MAKIIKHPDVEDYFVELTIDEIKARPNGIIDEYESNKLIILKDFRLPVDLEIFETMSSSLEAVNDRMIRKHLKKLTSVKFFENPHEEPTAESDDLQRAIFDVLCCGDKGMYATAKATLRKAHEVALELYETCFPGYDAFRLIPSVRLTQTLFENLHWDNHQIEDDFQQVRIFCNLDRRPRLWHVSHKFTTFADMLYQEHDLARFAGQDPNKMMHYINGDVMGGTKNACVDNLPKHTIAWDPGEIWFGESRMLSHQIFYGERAMVYMFFVDPKTMKNPDLRFNERVSTLHADKAAA